MRAVVMSNLRPLISVTILTALFAGATASAQTARAQSLVEMYRTARFKAQAERVLSDYRARSMAPDHLEYPTDSLREWIDLVFPREEHVTEPQTTALAVTSWDLIPKLGRDWFRKEFAEVRWAYIGSNSLSVLDTTFTRDLRARLEAEFGSPTQTIADLDHSKSVRPAEYIQFEYWFVVNDSIPLMVMDVNGPFERGLVVASSHSYSNILPAVKQAFIERLSNSRKKAPYADYYYLPEQRMWFLAGFDGEKHYLERISKPDLKLGRPLLERRP